MAATASTAPVQLLDLQRLAAGIRWRRRLWGGLALAGLVLGVVSAFFLSTAATATTRVYVVHEDEQAGDRTTLMQTDVAVARTSTVAGAALTRLGVAERPQDFLTEYSATSPAANILELTIQGRSGADALARARALADAFIADHVRRSRESGDAQARALLDRRAQVESELADLNRSIADLAALQQGSPQDVASQFEAFYGRRSVLATQIEQLSQEAQDASVGFPRVAAGTQVLDAPQLTSRSVYAAAVINAGIGLIGGLGIGLAIAAIGSVVRDRPVLRRDIAAGLGASVIAQVDRPLRGPGRLLHRSRRAAERDQVGATVARAVRDAPGGVSILELGCRSVAAELALAVATRFADDGPVVLVDDLRHPALRTLAAESPAGPGTAGDGPAAEEETPTTRVRWCDGADDTVAREPGVRHVGVGSVGPGTAWTDLSRLGSETVLVVRAGYATVEWLHTVARQLADAEVLVLGVVVVHPDPRDRSDGTLWDELHAALRGRTVVHRIAAAQVGPVGQAGRPDDGHPANGHGGDAYPGDAYSGDAVAALARLAEEGTAELALSGVAGGHGVTALANGHTGNGRVRHQVALPAADRDLAGPGATAATPAAGSDPAGNAPAADDPAADDPPPAATPKRSGKTARSKSGSAYGTRRRGRRAR